MTDLPDAGTCTCGHPKSTHGPGPKIATPIFCQGSSTCTCVIFTAATKSTDPPDAVVEAAAEALYLRYNPDMGGWDWHAEFYRKNARAVLAAASGPWSEQLDAARTNTDEALAEAAKAGCGELVERLRTELDAARAETEFWKANDNKRSAKVRKMRAERDALRSELDNLRDRVNALADKWDGEGIHSDDPLMALCDHEARAVIAQLRAAIVRGSDDE